MENPYPVFAVQGGELPPGITLDPVSGTLAGIATATGVFSGTFSATNASGTVTQAFVFTVMPPTVTVVNTVVGLYQDGPEDEAKFYFCLGIALGPDGTLYVGDTGNNRVRLISPDGVVSTLAGSSQGFADGAPEVSRFQAPRGLVVDRAGFVYLADTGNHRIRKIAPDGTVSTFAGNGTPGFADGAASDARFNSPRGLALASSGVLYVADGINHRIRSIAPDGTVGTVAGSGVAGFADGAADVAQFSSPECVVIGPGGDLYIADTANHRIRRIAPDGAVSTVAGSGTAGFADGAAGTAQFNNPRGVAVNAEGILFVTDYSNQRIRRIAADGTVSTLAGGGTAGFVDGPGISARFSSPAGILIDSLGQLHVADSNNRRIRLVQADGTVTTLAGVRGQLVDPQAAVDAGGFAYVVETGVSRISKVAPNGAVTIFAGGGGAGFAEGPGASAKFSSPRGIAADSAGNLYVADSANHSIRKITPDGVVSTFAGNGAAGFVNGEGATARFRTPIGIATDSAGNFYVGDSGNHRIRKIAPDGMVSTFAGSFGGLLDGQGTAAQFRGPAQLAMSPAGALYVVDALNQRLRQITPDGVVSTFYPNGISATAVAVDAANQVYVLHNSSSSILRISTDGTTTVELGRGSSTATEVNGLVDFASFSDSIGLSAGADGSIYVTGGGVRSDYTLRRVADTLATPPVFTSPALSGVLGVGQFYAATLGVTGNSAPVFALQSGSLPPGLYLHPFNGTIRGRPTAPGVYSGVIVATNSEAAATQSFAMVVSSPEAALESFLAAAGVESGRRGATDDPDGDRVPNLLEFALGLSPGSPDSAGLPVGAVVGEGEGRVLQLSYHRARGDLTYVVETTASLGQSAVWTTTGVVQGSPDANGNVTASIPLAGGPRFLRLRVTLAP